VEELERNLLSKALKRAGGVKKEAARLLGLNMRSFRYRLEKYRIGKQPVSSPDGDNHAEEE
jgi:two-component system response regulator PilR (NtrC family)